MLQRITIHDILVLPRPRRLAGIMSPAPPVSVKQYLLTHPIAITMSGTKMPQEISLLVIRYMLVLPVPTVQLQAVRSLCLTAEVQQSPSVFPPPILAE